MEINSEKVREKIQELFPNCSYNLTNRILDELCDEPNCKCFLQWFYSELSRDNVLTQEEVKLEMHMRKSGEWLEGEELEKALLEATKDNSDLLEVLESDVTEEDLSGSYFVVREALKCDQNYLRILERGMKNMKDIEIELDEELERERDSLKKIRIEEILAFEECLKITEKFDSIQRKLSDKVEQLVDIYSDAFQKKRLPCVWTQLPLDLLMKHMETYTEYLKFYIKKEFGTSTDEIIIEADPSIPSNDTDSDLILDDTNEKQSQERKIIELRSIHRRLNKAKLAEVIARSRRKATEAMGEYAQKIYNSGNVLIPKTPELLRTEIAELETKRNNLEKQVSILKERQVPDAIERHVNLIMSKILVDNARVTEERRENSIQKLKNLLFLARDRGHAHSDLLHILIDLENQKLSQVIEFVTDVRNYLNMEYSFSSKRCDWMLKAVEAVPHPIQGNLFNKYFTAIMGVEESPDSAKITVDKLKRLLEENERIKKSLIESLNDKVKQLRLLDRQLLVKLSQEFQGSDDSHRTVELYLDKTEKNVKDLQAGVLIIRNELKDMTEKMGSFEREKIILWQKFLTDPEALKSQYRDLLQKSQDFHNET